MNFNHNICFCCGGGEERSFPEEVKTKPIQTEPTNPSELIKNSQN